MAKPVIIFGADKFAELCWYELSRNSEYTVAGFTVDAAYRGETNKFGLPVAAFEDLASQFPPDRYALFISIGYRAMNQIRRDRFDAADEQGYDLISHVSPNAIVAENVTIGRNTIIFEGSVVQAFSQIGDNCIIRSAVHISHHNRVGDNAFIAAGVTTGGSVTVGQNCFIGLGTTIRDNITVGDGAALAAGSNVVADIESEMLFMGSPARNSGKRAKDVF